MIAKSLTVVPLGGDKIMARFMRQDFFEYIPQFKLVIAGNHKPAIRNVDEAMKRRLHLIPFTVTVPPARRDPELAHKLLGERDGILRWAVDGCLDWQQHGLEPPASVSDATQDYFEDEDAHGQWMAVAGALDPNAFALSSDLYGSWKVWAEENGEYVGSIKRLIAALAVRGLKPHRNSTGQRGLIGFRLLPRRAPRV